MSSLKKLIEDFNSLVEDELIDDFDDVEITDSHLDVEADKEINTTTELEAKTKISRALDVLKQAVVDFKNDAMQEIDLLADADLNISFTELDDIVTKIENILAGNNQQMQEPIDSNDEETVTDEEIISNEAGQDDEEIDFDAAAGLDLFADNEE